MIVLGSALALSGCASGQWMATRFDGKPLDRVHFDQAQAVCQGLTTSRTVYRQSSGGGIGGVVSEVERIRENRSIFNGCMAEHGYRITLEKVGT